MKVLKFIFKLIFFFTLIVSVIVFSLMYYIQNNVSKSYKLKIADKLTIESPIPVTATMDNQKYDDYKTKKAGDTFEVDLKIFGVIPFSSTTVEIVDDMYVQVLGNPFGMKLYTDGVLVSKIEGVSTDSGEVSPAEKSGLKVGDYIKTVNGKTIVSNEDLAEIVTESKGDEITLKIIRSGKEKTLKLKAVLEKDTNIYRAGIWIKDSSAGIGTLTFYSPSNNIVCGLGHAVCDSDTEQAISLTSGEIVNAEILSYKKGKKGEPGELNGKFTFGSICKDLTNDESGVYGHLCGKISTATLTKISLKQEVKNGKAQILTTIEGDSPKLYSCEITIKRKSNDLQNIIVNITDEELLEKTGGIVQGMSGSPILQNGQLVGAVTHVFLDDPTSGYGIFAENMLEKATEISKKQENKKAS